jgi:hypothetical protein
LNYERIKHDELQRHLRRLLSLGRAETFRSGTTSNVKVCLLGSADFYDEFFSRLLKKGTSVIDMSGDLPNFMCRKEKPWVTSFASAIPYKADLRSESD